MEERHVHYLGYVGDTRQTSVTVSIRRGTSKSDALFLLTKVIESLCRRDVEHSDLESVNEVRIASLPSPLRKSG